MDDFDADYEPHGALAAPEKVQPVEIVIPPAAQRPKVWVTALRWAGVFPVWFLSQSVISYYMETRQGGDDSWSAWLIGAFAFLVAGAFAATLAEKTAPRGKMAVLLVIVAIQLVLLGAVAIMSAETEHWKFFWEQFAALAGAFFVTIHRWRAD